MKRTALKQNPDKTREFLERGRKSSAESLNGSTAKPKPRPISEASSAQRRKVRFAPCVVCGRDPLETVIDPAHLTSRAQGGGDDPLDVVALCRPHHRLFDEGRLSLLEYLEPHYRDEIAQCVKHLGLIGAWRRLTNDRSVAG